MSSNKIVVIHLGSDGGNFLVNCLTMSNDVWLNDFNKQEKLSFYLEKTFQNNKSWADVTMCTAQLFPKFMTNSLLPESRKSVDLVFKKNKKIIFKTHYRIVQLDPESFEFKLLEKKPYVVTFQNPIIFSCLRNFFTNNVSKCCYTDTYSEFLGSPFPVDKKLNFLTIAEYSKLSENEKKEFEKKYDTNIYDLLNNFVRDKSDNFDETIQFYKNLYSYDWNVNWFLNENDTVSNIKKLYDVLELSDFDEKLIRKMYKAWIYKLDEIKKYQINKEKNGV